MLKGGMADKKAIIELTDCDLETSLILTSFFDIMIQDGNILVKDTDQLDRSVSIVRFAQKYDFANELRLMKFQLQAALSNYDQSERSPVSVFVIGSFLNEHAMCANAIRKAGSGWKWVDGSEFKQEKRFGQALAGGRVFDLGTCDVAHLEGIPLKIIWALLRSSHKPSTSTGAVLQAEHDAMAGNFARLMALEGKSDSSGLSHTWLTLV
jgi:hypothetical protein